MKVVGPLEEATFDMDHAFLAKSTALGIHFNRKFKITLELPRRGSVFTVFWSLLLVAVRSELTLMSRRRVSGVRERAYRTAATSPFLRGAGTRLP